MSNNSKDNTNDFMLKLRELSTEELTQRYDYTAAVMLSNQGFWADTAARKLEQIAEVLQAKKDEILKNNSTVH